MAKTASGEYDYSLTSSETRGLDPTTTLASYQGSIKINYQYDPVPNGFKVKVTSVQYKNRTDINFGSSNVCSGIITIAGQDAVTIRAAAGSAIGLGSNSDYATVPTGYCTFNEVIVSARTFYVGFKYNTGWAGNIGPRYKADAVYVSGKKIRDAEDYRLGVPYTKSFYITIPDSLPPPELFHYDYYDGSLAEKNMKINAEQLYNYDHNDEDDENIDHSNDRIETIKNFDKLREYVANLISSRTYTIPSGSADKSSYSIFNRYSDVNTSNMSLNEISGNKITQSGNNIANRFANSLNIIYDLIHNNYMNTTPSNSLDPTGSVSKAATNIKNSKNQNDIIPALKDYFTVVNYWNSATDTANDNRCNGACTGLCSGGCAKNNGIEGSANGTYMDKGPGYATGSCGGACRSVCWRGCSDTCDGNGYSSAPSYCKYCGWSACDGGCYSCSGSCAGCGSGCNHACSNVCSGCGSGCGESCDGCGSGCSGTCYNSCSQSCIQKCGTNCTFGATSR